MYIWCLQNFRIFLAPSSPLICIFTQPPLPNLTSLLHFGVTPSPSHCADIICTCPLREKLFALEFGSLGRYTFQLWHALRKSFAYRLNWKFLLRGTTESRQLLFLKGFWHSATRGGFARSVSPTNFSLMYRSRSLISSLSLAPSSQTLPYCTEIG